MTTDTYALSASAAPAATPDTPSVRLARGGGWWTFILALVMLLTMTEALYTAGWSEGLELIRMAVLGGAVLAFALSLTRWEGVFPALYSILASLAWIATLFNQSVFANLTSQEGIRELVVRNVNWFVALTGGAASADNLIFVTQLAFLGWWLGYLAIWSLVRHQRLLHAAIPTGIGLLINVYYSSEELTGFLVIFLAAVLLLAIRLELARNEVRWQLTRVRYAPDIALDFLKAGLAFTVLVIVLAWTVPNAAEQLTAERLLRPFESTWQKIEDTWNRMYKSLEYGTTAIPVSAFGKTSTLGGPVMLTDRPIFQAETGERTYWRAAVFDTYTGAGWINTDSEVVVIEQNEPLGEPRFSRTSEITVTIRSLEQGQTTIFTPPQPLRVSAPLNADSSPIPVEDPRQDDDGALRTVSLLRGRISLDRETPYQVTSAVTNASPDQLRDDITDYPLWVTQRYLQLPDDLPPRIRDLAVRTTMTYDNPYDKAEALESVLRTYTYNQQIAAPPPGADGVDYFLFDVQQGYCDYYASALVVMLRAVGVPARFVVGYTPGQVIEQDERPALDEPEVYSVLERNAHAWPEVYFPTYGWIQFEPTASEPQLARPTPEPSQPSDAAPDVERGLNNRDDPIMDDFTPPDSGSSGSLTRWEIWYRRNWGWLLGALLLAVAAAGGWWWVQTRQAAFFRDRELLAKLFGLLGLWAARLKIPWRASQTPLERATSFGARLPEATPVADSIAQLFVAQRYGREQPAAETLASVAENWRALQPALWRRWLIDAMALSARAVRFGPRRRPPDPGPGRSPRTSRTRR